MVFPHLSSMRKGKVENHMLICYIVSCKSPVKKGRTQKEKNNLKKKNALQTDQNPSTLDLWTDDDDGLRPSDRSKSSMERVEEHECRDNSGAAVLVGETDRGWVGGEGEKLNLGAGVMIPFRLGDFEMSFTSTTPGS